MITSEELEQKDILNKIKLMEMKVWGDIAKLRRSLAIIELFLDGLRKKLTKHQWNKNLPMINALWASAIDSIIICFGRLFNPNPESKECTLARYRNEVIRYIEK